MSFRFGLGLSAVVHMASVVPCRSGFTRVSVLRTRTTCGLTGRAAHLLQNLCPPTPYNRSNVLALHVNASLDIDFFIRIYLLQMYEIDIDRRKNPKYGNRSNSHLWIE
ncbi:MAG: hypothetical protein N2747_07770 [Chitinophagaceae bacterium]|nr:hypothetical protein [Chitinophagaceae bacterium]